MEAWVTLIFGACIGVLLTFCALFLDFVKKENKRTQEINNDIQSKIDIMSPRDFYINKISQNNLVWDRHTHTYKKTEQ
tara:strand:+ start:2202 stop:2435 length:234 start_codon:yes stop_codon:yes gene_type:complete